MWIGGKREEGEPKSKKSPGPLRVRPQKASFHLTSSVWKGLRENCFTEFSLNSLPAGSTSHSVTSYWSLSYGQLMTPDGLNTSIRLCQYDFPFLSQSTLCNRSTHMWVKLTGRFVGMDEMRLFVQLKIVVEGGWTTIPSEHAWKGLCLKSWTASSVVMTVDAKSRALRQQEKQNSNICRNNKRKVMCCWRKISMSRREDPDTDVVGLMIEIWYSDYRKEWNGVASGSSLLSII